MKKIMCLFTCVVLSVTLCAQEQQKIPFLNISFLGLTTGDTEASLKSVLSEHNMIWEVEKMDDGNDGVYHAAFRDDKDMLYKYDFPFNRFEIFIVDGLIANFILWNLQEDDTRKVEKILENLNNTYELKRDIIQEEKFAEAGIHYARVYRDGNFAKVGVIVINLRPVLYMEGGSKSTPSTQSPDDEDDYYGDYYL